MSRTEACLVVHRTVRAHTDRFLRNEAAMPAVLDALAIDPDERASVYHYIACLRSIMAGSVAWVSRSRRYRPEGAGAVWMPRQDSEAAGLLPGRSDAAF